MTYNRDPLIGLPIGQSNLSVNGSAVPRKIRYLRILFWILPVLPLAPGWGQDRVPGPGTGPGMGLGPGPRPSLDLD